MRINETYRVLTVFGEPHAVQHVQIVHEEEACGIIGIISRDIWIFRIYVLKTDGYWKPEGCQFLTAPRSNSLLFT